MNKLYLLALAILAFLGSAVAAPTIASVKLTDLPPEAVVTVRQIERGGPFPYRRDGTVFGNHEKRLPIMPRGTYREYTMPTPGQKGRGARRIVAGKASEYYYSGDHYRTFRRISE